MVRQTIIEVDFGDAQYNGWNYNNILKSRVLALILTNGYDFESKVLSLFSNIFGFVPA